MKHASVLLAFAGLGGLFAAGPAFAHAHLKSANPADETVVSTAPTVLTLDFTEGLNLAFSGADLLDASGSPVQQGKAQLSNGDDTLTIPLQSRLKPGDYTVKWHVLSTDGHKTDGSYGFTVKP
ncbi:copper homeostasis periplasmic binding protein CopC [Rhizobium halophytocola]|uniref:Methionine-rich copper-binding protein CopC n=1 Tax=Rhizobium halophytocola TaxID=735519 RepID=A0ABS4E4C8_9HYPH|nr:copper homeostasis periplasmic binding protein CopC [Rhizobium halophytocola]MBP1852789.1 methionine-rich copper-binding protein CopC [Rhizobium halophytocola]